MDLWHHSLLAVQCLNCHISETVIFLIWHRNIYAQEFFIFKCSKKLWICYSTTKLCSPSHFHFAMAKSHSQLITKLWNCKQMPVATCWSVLLLGRSGEWLRWPIVSPGHHVSFQFFDHLSTIKTGKKIEIIFLSKTGWSLKIIKTRDPHSTIL